MRKKIPMFSFVFVLLMCGMAMAGPIDNAREFQQQAARAAAKGMTGSQPKPVVVEGAAAAGGASDEMSEQPPAEESIKIEISEKEIDARVPALKRGLKDIIRDADANIKRIDGQLKAEEAQKGAKEHFDKGEALYGEGKFEQAGQEWNTALGLAKDLEFRKRIRGSLKRAARQIREAKEQREAEERAKKKAELKEKRGGRRKNVK